MLDTTFVIYLLMFRKSMGDFRLSADYFLCLSAIFRRMHFMFSSFQCRSGRTRLVRFGDIAWTALKASEKIRKPFESWIKALGNKGGPFLRDEFSVTPKTCQFQFSKTRGYFDICYLYQKHVEYICVLLYKTPKNCLFLGRKF